MGRPGPGGADDPRRALCLLVPRHAGQLEAAQDRGRGQGHPLSAAGPGGAGTQARPGGPLCDPRPAQHGREAYDLHVLHRHAETRQKTGDQLHAASAAARVRHALLRSRDQPPHGRRHFWLGGPQPHGGHLCRDSPGKDTVCRTGTFKGALLRVCKRSALYKMLRFIVCFE